MTIRLRLTLWYTALLGTTLILFSVTVYSVLAANLRAQLEQSAAVQARTIADAVAQQFQLNLLIVRNDPASLIFPEVELFASSVGVQLVNLDGRILTRSQNLGDIEIPNYQQALPAVTDGAEHRYYEFTGDDSVFLVYSVPLNVNDQITGAVQIIQPVTTAVTALNQAGRALVLGTIVSVVIAAIVGAFLARRALAPIDTITETASNITRTRDLGQRIQIRDNASEVGRLASTFNEMLDRIQRLFRAQERLVGDVSHELRTPLTTIQGNVDLMRRIAATAPAPGPATVGQRNGEIAELFDESLREMQAETERMAKMINDLLLLAQADSGALQLQMAVVEMDTLLLDVYRQARRLAERFSGPSGLEVHLGSEDQARVRGDYDRLRQVLLNFVDNAVKYTPAGGAITLGLEVAEGWVKVSVTDTGIGISEDQVQLIFDRFYRTDKARSRELGGSGLGLSIAQRLAEAHHGRITVTSKPHEGSTFTLWLPELVDERRSEARNQKLEVRN
jgi:signal transduction histidine kinase